MRASVVAARGLSCPATGGIFPDWGLNLCPYIGRRVLSLWITREVLFSFQPCCMVCGILVPQLRTEPRPLAVRMWSPKHWTTREFPLRMFLIDWMKQTALPSVAGSCPASQRPGRTNKPMLSPQRESASCLTAPPGWDTGLFCL